MIELRPEVRAFAEAMQRLLDEHQDEKGDAWKGDEALTLLASVYRQTDRLLDAIDAREGSTASLPATLRAAASVGAHAMFVADVCGALPGEERRNG